MAARFAIHHLPMLVCCFPRSTIRCFMWIRMWAMLWGAWFVLGAAQAARITVYDARVERVTDGDSLWVKPLKGGKAHVLRLQGVDAPELCQPHGLKARDILRGRLTGQVVRVQAKSRDTYGRRLARVEHQGDDVGGWMVQQGHAWSYRWRQDPGPYQVQEAWARLKRTGLHAQPRAERPGDFRRRHGPCHAPRRP